jgi:DNA-directed RNA polymerase subunit RPC12/RpoP
MISYLYCHECGKQVSTGFEPVPTDTPDRGIIVRAYIQCPECIEKQMRSATVQRQASTGA